MLNRNPDPDVRHLDRDFCAVLILLLPETKAGVIEFYRVCMQMGYSNCHDLKIKIVRIGTETLIFVQTVDLFDFLSG